ncbi:MAG: NAD+ kinase [Candidatus Azotimanducaceae bacterium]|jgi:NAD+ kinase
MTKFKRIGLVARTGNDLVLESLRRVQNFLNSQDVTVLLEDTALALLNEGDQPSFTQAQMADKCDLVIAIGGDGNILGAARNFAPAGVPIVGVNRGRVGFLADVSPENIEISIGQVLKGDYVIEEHFLLQGEVLSASGTEAVGDIPFALNEVIVHSAQMPKMLDFALFVDDQFVYNQSSDGLIISSPTGSTAYALSAGGPIMHPSLDAMVLIPMFPHTLNSRPLVVQGDSVIKIVVGEGSNGARISFDSQLEFRMEPGEVLIVRKKKEKLKLIHPPGHSFYGVCRSKLDWATRASDR